MQDEGENTTLLCGAKTVRRRFVNTSPQGKRPWPHIGFVSRKSDCSRLLLTLSLSYTPPQSPHTLSSFQERSVKKHGILQHSLQVWRREEGKKAVPPSQADWRHLEALGVRHSSSSFPHWRFYKQVSNTPDLVWQTFSKEHLKRGWESDTPTCVFFFWRRGLRQIQVSTPLFNQCHVSPHLLFMLLFVFLSTLRGLMWSPQLHKK